MTSTIRPLFAYVGSYATPERHGACNRINIYRVDPRRGGFSHVQHLGGLENPSFSPSTRLLYRKLDSAISVVKAAEDPVRGRSADDMRKRSGSGLSGFLPAPEVRRTCPVSCRCSARPWSRKGSALGCRRAGPIIVEWEYLARSKFSTFMIWPWA